MSAETDVRAHVFVPARPPDEASCAHKEDDGWLCARPLADHRHPYVEGALSGECAICGAFTDPTVHTMFGQPMYEQPMIGLVDALSDGFAPAFAAVADAMGVVMYGDRWPEVRDAQRAEAERAAAEAEAAEQHAARLAKWQRIEATARVVLTWLAMIAVSWCAVLFVLVWTRIAFGVLS